MRLRWGPHASQSAEQVVLADPHYVLSVLDDHPAGVLADVFRELILAFDTKVFTAPCARCGGPAEGVCAYPASTDLIGFCGRCEQVSDQARPAPSLRVASYEDALRHVVTSFRRGHRIHMRRIIRCLLLAKAGPARLTEESARDFFHAPFSPPEPSRRPDRQASPVSPGPSSPVRRPQILAASTSRRPD